ncbi:NADP-dependent malic enzyme [Staphylococcus aureus]|uniref:NAD(P)-dependent malic enzyme n=1 Tax=Staphylococcus aureus TaxID=1280 RepID=UPI0035B5A03C
MSLRDEALEMHKRNQGKLEVKPNVKVTNKEELSLAYSPGVAEPCKDIYEDKRKVYDYTIKGNTVAVITDGTAVLGLGNIGPEASIPVMEGKAVLFKSFAGINGVPIALNTTDTEEIIKTVKLLEPNYGGINLEDISAPRCFEIEERLKKETNIPVFHDDQHGTAIVTMAGLVNALRVVNEVEATHINEEMKKAAVEAIADLIDSSELNEDYCIPGPFDKRVAPSVARNVAKAAMESGVARIEVDPQDVYDKTMKLTDLQ